MRIVNKYTLIAYDYDYRVIGRKVHFGSYSSEIRGYNQMQRNLNRAMNNFRHETGAKEVVSRFEGN